MSLKSTLEAFELLDSANASGNSITSLFNNQEHIETRVKAIRSKQGKTDFIQIIFKGSQGKRNGGQAKTLGIIGRLGGIGARPTRAGLVSDADGALTVVATALKLATMIKKGDRLSGDVALCTHICPDASTIPHEPVDFMASPVDSCVMNAEEVLPEMDAILSFNTTKGNRIINYKGIAISPTVKSGWILPIADDLIQIMTTTTGLPPIPLPLCHQDITPCTNGLYHFNSIMQPAIATDVPVVGIGICAQSTIAGNATGANHENDIADAVRFALEVAKSFGKGECKFYNIDEYNQLIRMYGDMSHLQR